MIIKNGNDPQAFVHNLNAPKHWRLEYGKVHIHKKWQKLLKMNILLLSFDFNFLIMRY